MFEQRFQMFNRVRAAIKKLIQEYHASVKLSYENKDQGKENTIGYFLNDNIEICDKEISLAMYDTPMRIDFVHERVIKKHYGKIVEALKIRKDRIAPVDYLPSDNEFMAEELKKIRLWF